MGCLLDAGGGGDGGGGGGGDSSDLGTVAVAGFRSLTSRSSLRVHSHFSSLLFTRPTNK